MNHRRWCWLYGTGGLFALLAGTGCQPGYMKASELESRGQGPSACAKSCEDIGMRMGAMVLVSNDLPGCVCQPVTAQAAPPKVETPPPPATPAAAPTPPAMPPPVEPPAAPTSEAAGAATTGYVVLVAAAAARQAQLVHKEQNAKPNY